MSALAWRCDRCQAEGVVLNAQNRAYVVMREHAKASPTCEFDANHVWAWVED